jgi:hypothetical protein
MIQQTATEGVVLGWTAILNIANTFLVALLGFLLREAWVAIHKRMDALEEGHGDMRERVAIVETVSGVHNRRRTDREAE